MMGEQIDKQHRIVLASGNQGKVREIQQMVVPLDLVIVSQDELGVPSVPETGLTFVENAIIKARNAASHTGLPALADDSGIEVDALNGQPGIYSARFAGEGASDADNLNKLLESIKDLSEAARTARFQCLMVYLRHAEDPTPIICQGTWEGRILNAPQGENGFGYDPVFYVPDENCSAAQLASALKNRLSHRGQALSKLIEVLSNR